MSGVGPNTSRSQTEFHSTGFDGARMVPEIENNFYRIAQEALNNVAKHSRATTVDILLERQDHQVVLIVEDNGVGFAEDPLSENGFGLTGMRERASLLNGAMEIESKPNQGTTLFVTAPIDSRLPAGKKVPRLNE